MELTFRKLENCDIAGLMDLYFQEEELQIDNNQSLQYIEKGKRVYDNMLRRGSYIYSCIDVSTRKLIAAITVNKCLDLYPGYWDNPYVHLETFIVHKDYQNQGVGTQLLQHVLDVVKTEGCTYIIIQSNVPAVQHIAYSLGLTGSCTDMRIDFINMTSQSVEATHEDERGSVT